MKKFYKILFAFFLLITHETVFAQPGCPQCPTVFLVSDSIGCNSVDVVKSPTGQGPYTNAFRAITACQNSTMGYTITPNPVACFTGATYTILSVSNGTLITASGNQFTIQWGTASTGNVTMLFSSPPGSGGAPCRDTISLNYNLITSPIAAFTFSPQPACFNNPTNISFNSSTSVNAVTYFWDFGDGFTSTMANPTHGYTAPGTYTVSLTVTNTTFVNGVPGCPDCTDSVQHTVVIDALPGPPIPCIASVCAGDTETYCTTAPGCTGFLWTVTGGTIQSGQNTPCVTVNWGSGNPQGTLNLVTTGCTSTYCPQGTTVNIPIIPLVGTISGPSLVCVNSSSNYSLPAWPGTTYSWVLSGGGVIAPANTNTAQITVNWGSVPNNYTLTANYYDSALNCGGTATFTVNVRPLLSITGPQVFCAGQSSNLNAVRPGNIPVPSNWSISPAGAVINSGNGTGSINVSWNNPGTYTVTAAPTVGSVCGSASYLVTVNPVPVISGVTGADSVCANQTYVYAAVSNQTGLFTWNVTNGTSSTLGVNNDSIQVTWAGSGPYLLSVFQTTGAGCVSNTFNKQVFPYPTPAITGPVNVCADNTATYTITNIAVGNFNWFVTPASFGTILSGQGTSSVQIKWHGNNNPGNTNTVYLHFGVCNADSIAININEPPLVTITPSGTLCGGGVTLSTGATGTFLWTGSPNPPPPPGTNPSITVTQPGTYTVQIQNYNGSGCTVTGVHTVPDVGRPIASISADDVLNYCLPALPNLNLVAVNGAGYTFQWYQSPATPLGTGVTQPVNNLTSAGTYTYYVVVTLGTCQVTSNPITITIQNCPGPGCVAEINETSVTGCNPFTFTITATQPAGSTITGTPTIYHYDDNTTVSGLTTHTFTSAGYKQVRICATVLYSDNVTTCGDCKDVTVLVNGAPYFTSQVVCNQIFFTDASTTVSPTTISSYAWTVGSFPGNLAVPPAVASFNATNIPSPVLTANVSGTYIVSLTIVAGGCTMTHRDTFSISVPNADFTGNNSCVGTPVNFNNLFPAPTNFWDFGDAATAYSSPATHAYAAPGPYNVTHIVTDAAGCKDTVIKTFTIVAAPTCTISLIGMPVFCFGDTLVLKACSGLTNIQWYNNGVAIPGATNVLDTVTQTGNYSFLALDPSGCIVTSDTVNVTVLQAPNVNITLSANRCEFSPFTAGIPNCPGCTIQWYVDGNPAGNSNQVGGTIGSGPLTIGTHIISVAVTNGLGCVDSSAVTVTFVANPTASINVSGNPPMLCSNNLYTMSAVTNAASPLYAWQLNNAGPVLSANSSLLGSAAGAYTVTVTDGITGCSAAATQNILPSPELNLFPIGCDTLCDTSNVFLPLASMGGNLTGYTINWYDNAPPYSPSIATGPSLNLSLLPLGNHNLSVIVVAPNGCRDTSNVYNINIIFCSGVVAVRGLDLNAKQKGGVAALQWFTDNESNNSHFVLERSLDAVIFENVVNMPTGGNNSGRQYYHYNDPIVVYNRPLYYRVKAVDVNGNATYSRTVRLDPVKVPGESITALPNITKGQTDVLLQTNTGGAAMLYIHSSTGAAVRALPVTLRAGTNKLPLQVGDLPPGLYVFSIRTQQSLLSTTLIRN